MRRKKVVVVGQGYVGLPLAMQAFQAGMLVTGVDVNELRVRQILSGQSPIPDVPSTLLRNALVSGRYKITRDYATLDSFDYAIISVPTPLKNHQPDLTFIREAGSSIGPRVKSGSTVVLESTTYPGTTEELLIPILESTSGLVAGEDFYVGYSPERIDPGNKVWTFHNTPKIIAGMNLPSLQSVREFYEMLGIQVEPATGLREAEMAKLLENTFRHVNIALVNELLVFSRKLRVNMWEAIDLAETKPFGFMKFLPGPGVGGHCLPVDPSFLSWAIHEVSGQNSEFVELANRVNAKMPQFVAERAAEILQKKEGTIAGSRILIYGLAYKPNTADTRESPSMSIASALVEKGAHVFGEDPLVSDADWPSSIRRHSSEEETYALGILVTPHDELPNFPLQSLCSLVLDTRNVMDGDGVLKL